MVTRSNISVVSAVRQPSLTWPTTASAGRRTSSRKTSLNSASPEIWRRPRTVTPSASIGSDEHRQALVLVLLGVGARQQQAVGGELGVGGPHLLAVEDPGAVVLLARARLHRREVRAGGGLGEELAPHLVAVEHRREVARLLLLGAVGDDRRPEHADADDVEDAGHARPRDLLADDDLLDRPRPWPPTSTGQVTPARPPSASWPCQRRRASTYASSSAPARVLRASGACALCSCSQARTFWRYSACCGVSFRSTRTPLADWPVGPREYT